MSDKPVFIPCNDIQKQIISDVIAERFRQDEKWGEQNHLLVREEDIEVSKEMEVIYKQLCDFHEAIGTITWYDILMEEVFEAFAESDKDKQRQELIQVIAVGVVMVECLDRKQIGKEIEHE
jgi:hypothetical protein